MSSLLRMEAVALRRGGRPLFEALDLSLEPGDALLLSGPNGVGKSSLIRLAAGLLRASAGTVARDVEAALADDGLALDSRLSLLAALRFWARLDDGDAAAGIEAMGLGLLASAPMRLLSTGQRKRAVLARVVASGAPLWLLDEPANGLDGEGQARLASAMAVHRAGGGAILAASHLPLGLDGARSLVLA